MIKQTNKNLGGGVEYNSLKSIYKFSNKTRTYIKVLILFLFFFLLFFARNIETSRAEQISQVNNMNLIDVTIDDSLDFVFNAGETSSQAILTAKNNNAFADAYIDKIEIVSQEGYSLVANTKDFTKEVNTKNYAISQLNNEKRVDLSVPLIERIAVKDYNYELKTSIQTSTTSNKCADIVYTISIVPHTYNITYELEGGTLPDDAPRTYDNRKDTSLVTPTKEGYTFNGWKMNIKPDSWEDGFISIETGEDGIGSTGAGYPNAKRTGFIKLNKGVTYKLSINDAYGRLRIYDINKKYMGNLPGTAERELTITPEKDIYARILVLNSNETNIEDVYFHVEGYVSMIPKGTTGNITLNAIWTPITYTIKLHGNGGRLVEGKSDTIQATYDQNITIPYGVFVKFNTRSEALLNYNTKSNGSGKTYNVREPIKNLTNENGGVVNLYAQWNSAIDFNSIYHKGCLGPGYSTGENVKSFDYIITKPDGSTIKKQLTNGDIVYFNIEQGDIVELKFIDYRFGYQFNRFKIHYSNDSNSAINNGITVLSQDETSIKFRVDKTYSDTRSVICLAWYNEEIPYSLSYNLDGGTLSNGGTNPTGYNVRSEKITLNNPTKVGYTFEGWEEVLRPTQWHKGDLNSVQGDPNGGAPMESTRGAYYSDFMSVKAGNRYKCNTYGMGYLLGARYYDKNFNYVTYATDVLNVGYNVPQDGYIRFVLPGYEKNKDTVLPHAKLTNMTLQKDITIEKGSVGNREYSAKWVPIQWTVKYDANGGNGTMEDSFHIFDGYNKLNKNTFSRNGYNFSGWHLSRVNNGKTEWLYGNKEGIYVDTNQWYEIGKQPSGYVLYKMRDQQVFQEANRINDAIIIAHAQWTLQKYFL